MQKILIIEDEPAIADLINLNISLGGYQTLQALDGKIGLEYIKTLEIDLVILDLMLPEIDGYQLLPYILAKKNPGHYPNR